MYIRGHDLHEFTEHTTCLWKLFTFLDLLQSLQLPKRKFIFYGTNLDGVEGWFLLFEALLCVLICVYLHNYYDIFYRTVATVFILDCSCDE